MRARSGGDGIVYRRGNGEQIEIRYLHRRRAVGRGAVAQLPEEVASPGRDRSIGEKGHAMTSSGGKMLHIWETGHIDRRGAVSGSAVAQLAVIVVPPG